MGLDINTLKIIKQILNDKPLKKTVTLGRQRFRAIYNTKLRKSDFKYCEPFLIDFLHASQVDSIDYSDYEGATKIFDMNKQIPDEWHNQYDTVIDSGFSEHLYNFPQVMKNCSLLCKPGGHIIHLLPANNFCGHGFYQISPQLFFSLYTQDNGYRDTEIFIMKNSNPKVLFRVDQPKPTKRKHGARIKISSSSELSIIVKTVLEKEFFSHENIQQNDYLQTWSAHKNLSKSQRESEFLLRCRRLYLRIRYGIRAKNGGLTPQCLPPLLRNSKSN